MNLTVDDVAVARLLFATAEVEGCRAPDGEDFNDMLRYWDQLEDWQRASWIAVVPLFRAGLARLQDESHPFPYPIPDPLPAESLYTLTDHMTMLGLGVAGTCLECGWFQVHATKLSASQGVSGHIRQEHGL